MTAHEDRVTASFAHPRFEIVPMLGVEQQLPYLPRDVTVTVTSSPTRGIEAALAVASLLHRRNRLDVVPYLAARLVRDETHLKDLLRQFSDMGLEEIVVTVGAVDTPVGPYADVVQVLDAMAEIGHTLRIGIFGHPEPPAGMSAGEAASARAAAEPYADYIVTQVCYDGAGIARWLTELRSGGTDLPVWIGLPGVMDTNRLLRISRRLGVGASLHALPDTPEQAETAPSYRPDALVEQLTPVVADPGMGVAGWHLYTFNEVRRTELWRREMLARRAGAMR